MYTAEQKAVLGSASRILKNACDQVSDPGSYMTGWRAGRAEQAAQLAAQHIQATLYYAGRMEQATT